MLPTPNQLMKKLSNNEYYSINSGDSRTITNFMDEPVVAYGIGYCGFVVIIKNSVNKLLGYEYISPSKYSLYEKGKFHRIIDHEVVLKEIKNNKLIVEKDIDYMTLNKCSALSSIMRPVIGNFKYTPECWKRTGTEINEVKYIRDPQNWKEKENEIRFVRLKSGKIRVETSYKWSKTGYKKEEIKYVFKILTDKIHIYKPIQMWNSNEMYQEKEIYVLKDINVSDKLLKEIENQIFINEI